MGSKAPLRERLQLLDEWLGRLALLSVVRYGQSTTAAPAPSMLLPPNDFAAPVMSPWRDINVTEAARLVVANSSRDAPVKQSPLRTILAELLQVADDVSTDDPTPGDAFVTRSISCLHRLAPDSVAANLALLLRPHSGLPWLLRRMLGLPRAGEALGDLHSAQWSSLFVAAALGA